MMDKGPEWRAFIQEEKASRSRVGMPTSYSVHDKGLSKAISQVDGTPPEENFHYQRAC